MTILVGGSKSGLSKVLTEFVAFWTRETEHSSLLVGTISHESPVK
jgi:hypothetical protein